MYVVDVVPITKIPFPSPQMLSYYSQNRLGRYSVVNVPLKKRMSTPALVLRSHPLSKYKAVLKKAAYQVRSVNGVIHPEPALTDTQFKLARWVSDYYYSPLGLVLKNLFPQKLYKKSPVPASSLLFESPSRKSRKIKKILLWQEDRWKEYEKVLRAQKDAGRQTLFLIPEINRIDTVEKNLARFAKDIILLHGSLKQSVYWNNWKVIRENSSGIILGSRSSLFASFINLGCIIIDEEDNPHYKSWDMHPRYHARDTALQLAKLTGADVILGSSFPSVESYFEAKRKKYVLVNESKRSSPRQGLGQERKPRIVMVDMREELKRGNHSIFSEDLRKNLAEVLKDGSRAILFINRRGFATFILCRDCGYVVKCQRCDSPMVYHELTRGEPSSLHRKIVCHHCGASSAPPNVCPNCGGWKIRLFGAGTQRVAEEFKKYFPLGSFLRLDSDTAKNVEVRNKIFTAFARREAPVLIGTQLLLHTSRLPRVSFFGVVSMETILHLPDFRSGERTLQLIRRATTLTKKRLLIQTYRPDHYAFRYLEDTKKFYKEELRVRKSFGWPPYAQLIKLRLFRPDQEKAVTEAERIKEKLHAEKRRFPHNGSRLEIFGPLPALIPKVKGGFVYYIVIKLHNPHRFFSRRDLELRNQILRVVPRDWSIDVDPESIL